MKKLMTQKIKATLYYRNKSVWQGDYSLLCSGYVVKDIETNEVKVIGNDNVKI